MSFHTIEYTSDLVGNNAPQHSSHIIDAQNRYVNSQAIFTYDGGIPMLFFIPFDDPNRFEYREKIINHGGITTDTEPNSTTLNRINLLSSYNLKGHQCYKLSYIDDSIKNNSAMNLNSYKYNSELEYSIPASYNKPDIEKKTEGKSMDLNVIVKTPKQATTRSALRFNDLKDAYILKHIRLNARLRNSHKFFDELATHDILKGHTGNSIRSRYRNHLESKLGYVYKTDDDGALVTTPDGKHIRQSLENMPKTLKNRFTAQEDYNLCNEIVKYSKARYLDSIKADIASNNENKPLEFDYYSDFSVPVSFFSMMARNYPTHSYHSWRDRYRKFVKNYGAQKYIDDYEKAIENGETPEQMKNFTGKKFAANQVIKHLIGSNYDDVLPSISDRNSKALDEEISEIKSSDIKEVLNSQNMSSIPNEDKSTIDDELSSRVMSSQEGSNLDIKYIGKNVTHEDLFNKNFYEIKPGQLPGLIENILQACHGNSLSFLFSEFEKIGIKDAFTAHILMATSADIAKIKIFVARFLDSVTYLQETEIYKGLQVEDIDGLWTQKFDNWLIGNNDKDIKKLRKVQTQRSINTRKDFLSKLLQFQ